MSSFGGTVKLTGESEYKQALADISSKLKVLNSEMKTVTSQYDKNDKSVDNLSSQNEVLNKKIEEQERKVKLLKQALEDSEKETGENSETTRKWQTELNNAQAELNNLNRKVKDNSDAMKEAEQGTNEEASAVEEFGKEADKSGESALKLGDIIKANLIADAIKAGLSALVDGFKSLGSALGDCLQSGAAYADNLLTLSAQTGLSTDTLEKYNAVAELTDVSMETLTKSMAKNLKSMSDARDGSKAYADAYKKLGVEITNADGSLRDSETVYWETIDALKGITDETERDAMAMELFGKKAQELNTIIEMGSEGVAEYTQMAVDMGAVLGGEGLAALGALDDQMQIFSTTTDATKNILASAFAPAMTSALEGVNGLGGALNNLIASVISGEGVDEALTQVSESVTGLISGIETALPQVMQVAGELFKVLLEAIAQNLPTLINEGSKMLSSLLSGISKNIGTVMTTIMTVIQTLLNTIIQNLPMILEMGIQMLVSLIDGLAETLPELIPVMIDAVVLCVETLLDNLDLLIDSGIELILALADGLIEALPDLIEKIPVIVDKLVQAITENLPKIIEAGITLTLKIAEGLVKAIPDLVAEIPGMVKSLVSGFTSCWSSIKGIGTDLVKGIWNGINDATTWIINKIKGFGQSVLDGLKSFFGIKSPSRLFKDEIGTNLALGVGEGFSDTMAKVSSEMQGAIPTEFDASVTTKLTTNGQASSYDLMVGAFKKALSDMKIVLDEREVGNFVTDTVERQVFA